MMSLMHREHEAAGVSADGGSGRPVEVRLGPETWLITAIEAVRDETAAYAVETGPRTVFVVRSDERRFRLVNLHRDRRWTVEPLEPVPAGLSIAA